MKWVYISRNKSDGIFQIYKQGRTYDYIITVCEKEMEDKCPTFPGIQRRISSGFEDPSKFEGTDEEKLEQIRRLRDRIKARVEKWIENL